MVSRTRPIAWALPVLAVLAAGGATAPADAATRGGAVRVYETEPHSDKGLERRQDLHFSSAASNADFTINVHPAQRLQRIRGFGAAITDTSAYLLSRLPAKKRHHVLVKLLDPRRGIGLSVMRVPMGASDFSASGVYSYDDMPAGQTDPKLRHFSIAHDRAYILPVLREALRINPKLRLIANPWSPPAWMKTNDSMFAVSLGGPGVLKPDAYDPLARYFVRFIKEYRKAGVPIWAITPQNEPQQPTADYPGLILSAPEEAAFVRDHLKPAIDQAGLRTRIYGYDYTWLHSEDYVGTLMSGPDLPLGLGGPAKSAVDGIAYHCYFGAADSMSTIHGLYPNKDVIEDECSTGISVQSPIQVLLRSVNNWAGTVLMWNSALDPSGGPKIGSGCFTCIGVTTIDPGADTVAYTGNYWQLGQASRFVRRGARRIGADASPNLPTCGNNPVCGLELAAFRNRDGSKVVVATSSGPDLTFAIRRADGKQVSYALPQQQSPNGTDNSVDAGVVTLVWGGQRPR